MIAGIYAGAGAILLVVLSALVVAARVRARVSLGDGGDPALEKTVRAQGNFVEYAPLGLLLILLAELQGAPAPVLHGLGLALLAGRVLHAWGITRRNESNPGRWLGTVLTFGMLLAGGGLLVVQALA